MANGQQDCLSKHVLQSDGTGGLGIAVLDDDRAIEMDALLRSRSFAYRTTAGNHYGTFRNDNLTVLICTDIFTCRCIIDGCRGIDYHACADDGIFVPSYIPQLPPMNTLSSIITGSAPTGSSTPPSCEAAERCTCFPT